MRSILAGILVALAGPALAAPPFSERADVQAFIGELVARDGFVDGDLRNLFSRVQRVEPVLQLIPPAERPSWDEYRAQFVNEQRVSGGLAFWKANRRHLARAERDYGVPAQVIVAILGVETNYGRHMGRYRVVDALTTLAFDYAPRASFFRSELEQYLLLVREWNVDVFALRGSYAGAMGLPQFMPGSVRRYAVDFDGNGSIDLRNSSADAIGSVANFLKSHGWQAGAPVALRAKVSAELAAAYGDAGAEPRHRLAELIAAGVALEPAPPSAEALGTLVTLGGEYRVGLQNFYVITRYNRSVLYAGAVSDLADALAERAQSAGR